VFSLVLTFVMRAGVSGAGATVAGEGGETRLAKQLYLVGLTFIVPSSLTGKIGRSKRLGFVRLEDR
jgi:hypothetical protein